MCVLMLRGPQTPGELKQRTERMHAFGDLAAVHATLERLIERELVARLDRRPGQKEERYTQLLRASDATSLARVRATRRRQPAPSAARRPAGARVRAPRRRGTRRARAAPRAGRAPRARGRGAAGAMRHPAGDAAVIHAQLILAASSDTATGVGIPLALAAGLVSFLSPCVLPLVPGYLSTVIGVTPADLRTRGRPPGARPEPAVHRELLADLHPAGNERDRHRLGAQRPQTRPRAGRRRADHRHGRDLPRDAVRQRAQPRVALRVAAAPRRARRTAGRGRGLRDRVDARARASRSARSSRRPRSRARPPTGRCCSPSTPRAWRSRSC